MVNVNPHLQDYLQVIMRRRWAVITFFTVLVITVLIGSLKQTPIYEATATILIERQSPRVVAFAQVTPMGADDYYFYKDYYETQYKLLQSRSLMEKVAISLSLDEQKKKKTDDVVDDLLKIIKVNPIKNSQLVKLSAEDPQPEMAAKIANTVAQEYINQHLERSLNTSTEAAKRLAKQIEEQRDKLQKSEIALQRYRQDNNINILPQIKSEEAVEDVKAEYAKLQALSANYAERYTDEHPKMIELKAQISSLRNKIQGLEDYDKESKAAEYRVLERDVQTNKQLFEVLLTRMKEIDLSSTLNLNNITIIDSAAAPELPIRPNLKLNLTLAVMVGLILGIGLAFFIDYLDRTIKSPQDVKELLESHFLGSIPSIVGDNIVKRDKIVFFEPQSPVSESYRIIRTEILHLLPQNNETKSILITSGEPQSGKTLTVSNIGIAFSQKGSRVLLVDGDLRKPQLHKIFDFERYRGLSEYLTGEIKIDDIIKKTEIENLSIVTAGKVPHYPAEILSSGKIEEFINQLKGIFDYLIFDSPPVVSVTDSIIFADRVDAIIQVVRSGRAIVPISQRVKEQLSHAKGKVLGIILNDLKTYHDNYYYYRYYKYYGDKDSKHKKEFAITNNDR